MCILQYTATLVPRVLPPKSQVKINIFTIRHLFFGILIILVKRESHQSGITEGKGVLKNQDMLLSGGHSIFFKTLQDHFESILKALTKKFKEMSELPLYELEADIEQYLLKCKRLIIVVKTRCLELEVELSNLRDDIHKKHDTTPKKKASCLEDQSATSSSTTHKHVEPRYTQKSNVPVPPSTGVSSCTDASGSQPRSILKKHRIPPAKSDSLKKVEDHSRIIRSSLRTTNRVDSSISSKRTFIGTVRFGNDHFGAILGYGDYVIGDCVISRVYYVEGLGYNLFFVGQFCDSDLEVAFRKHSCYVRDTDGVELLKGSRGSNLYTIFVEDMMKSSPICLLSKASKHKSWLWHRRLNHLNFGTINDLARKDLVRGLPRLKFEKDHLCSACQLGKSKKHTHKPKTENTNLEVLNTLHMDLCGPMRVQTINGKKYILVIVDDYSRFTWVKFLRSKDETPTVVIKFLKQIQVGLNKTVRFIRTDNGTEFVNKTLYDYYESVGIFHQKTVPRTPQQNGVVERRNRTLVEAARTMLIFSKAPMFLWAEAVATACYTQNRSLIHTRHDKTPYELVHNKKPDLTFFRVFGALCYPTNDSENLGKLQPRADIGIFIGYAPSRKGYRIYNKRTRQIMETIHVQFDELTEQIAPVQSSPGPAPSLLTPGPIKLEMLFQPMFDEYFNPSDIRQDPIPNVAQDPVIPTGPSVSISFDLDAPSGKVNPFAAADPEPFVNVFVPDPTSEASSSREIKMPEPIQSTQPHEHIRKWTDSHPLDNIIGNPSRLVSTRKQLTTDALWCLYNSLLSKVEPKNFKSAATKDCWFQAMQSSKFICKASTEKKRKPVSESSEAPPLAKRAKAGKVVKNRTVKSSKQETDTWETSPLPRCREREENLVLEVWRQERSQAGPDPGKLDEGQAGPEPEDVLISTFYQLPSVLAKPNLGTLQMFNHWIASSHHNREHMVKIHRPLHTLKFMRIASLPIANLVEEKQALEDLFASKAPPPPPPSSSTHQGDQSTSTCAQVFPQRQLLLANTLLGQRLTPLCKNSITTIPDDLYMDDETTADEQAYSSGDRDYVGRGGKKKNHIPTVNLRQSWWKPLTEDRPASPKPAWTIRHADLPVRLPYQVDSLQQRSEYLRYGSQDSTNIVYLKDERGFYPDVGLGETDRLSKQFTFRTGYQGADIMRYNWRSTSSVMGPLQQIDEALDNRGSKSSESTRQTRIIQDFGRRKYGVRTRSFMFRYPETANTRRIF
ncbi:retrovirus-related pol polyprotein from transposon TNT 1-94 [Tanacetum coccineum]